MRSSLYTWRRNLHHDIPVADCGFNFIHDSAAAALANNEPPRRKPGRPKGSKNKKKYDLSDSTPKQQFATTPFYGYTPPQAPPAATPVIPPVQTPAPQSQPIPQPAATVPFPALDANNQAFYDFQWRVLTLCSEFYNAADELIVSSSVYRPESVVLSASSARSTAAHHCTMFQSAPESDRSHQHPSRSEASMRSTCELQFFRLE